MTGYWYITLADKEAVGMLGVRDTSCIKTKIVYPEEEAWLAPSLANEEEGDQGHETLFVSHVQVLKGRASGIMASLNVKTQGDASVQPVLMGKSIVEEGEAKIVELEKDSHLIIYSCKSFPDGFKFEVFGVAARNPNLSKA